MKLKMKTRKKKIILKNCEIIYTRNLKKIVLYLMVKSTFEAYYSETWLYQTWL